MQKLWKQDSFYVPSNLLNQHMQLSKRDSDSFSAKTKYSFKKNIQSE